MRGLTALDQAIVDKQTKAIEEALENLEFKDADYSAYDDAVEKANALDKSLYTDTAELERLLSKNIRGLTILNQDIVDTQTQAILDAINALVYKPADLTEYYKAVEQAEAIDRSLYEDLTALDEVLKIDVSNKNITKQAEVDAQTQAILDALNALVYKPADLTEYYKAVEQAEAIDRSLYEDLTALDEVLKVDVSNKNITEQAEVDAQTQAILDAINALIYKPADLTEYYKAVEQAEAIDRDLYEDLTALDEALTVDVSNKNITEQAEVDAQTRAILDAINGLVEKEVPTQPTTPTEPEVPTEPVEPTTPENIYGKRQRDFYSLSA